MGNDYQHRHQATDGLLNLFTKANHDLALVHHRLEKEFQQVYPDNVSQATISWLSQIGFTLIVSIAVVGLQANPMKLVSRIKKIQQDISTLKEQCHELLAAKQDLIDKAQRTLVENRDMVQRMQASTGIPLTDDDDSAFTNFKQIIEEWAAQVRSRTGDDTHDCDSGDVNKLLFSAIA
ncbi:spindle and kinetochore-associated protein 2 [Senna tora]|uniref:Protein FAM33A n=1 Tax=Senna tora TaxID=362788 RepID=A0A834T827_9FABA|nr:spindle and kinetochore-associated protein 2 [Senna tora]